jgi:hypothetical protein
MSRDKIEQSIWIENLKKEYISRFRCLRQKNAEIMEYLGKNEHVMEEYS